jgi:DNA-binding NtrC family response regulator
MPLNDILGYSEELLGDVGRQGWKSLIPDLQKIHASGKKLLTIVDYVLDDMRTITGGEGSDRRDDSRLLGHEMRMPLNAIIGYSEMLIEDAKEQGQEKLISDLQEILSTAKHFLGTINEIINFPSAEAKLLDVEQDVSSSSVRERDSASAALPVLGDSLTAGAGSLLVVDDDALSRDLLARQLERQGHSITTAEDGLKALELMKSQDFDLILLDIVMPELDGFEVLRQMKSDDAMQDIPVIVVSALGEMEDVVRCLQMGAEDYLLKPFNPVLLKARISTCLERIRLREMCEALEVKSLKEDVQFVAESEVMKNVLSTARSVSRSPINVLIHGESGTGKEMIARIIHNGSDRKDKPFVAVNCASIPENLMESEFFGYEKGAFTGAVSSHAGRFEEASGGTLFLDEIGDMPPVIQPKFLRVIQEGEGCRLGSNKPVRYDLRLISASNQDIKREVAEGRFREDLFYRIFSVEIYIPRLRERLEDIVPLTMLFINNVSKSFRKKVAGFSPEVLSFFEKYPWPGNVRQLLHEVERMIALTPEGGRVSLKHCSEELKKWRSSHSITTLNDDDDLSMPDKVKELEITCIKDALGKTAGNKLQASKLLGITRQGLDKKIKRYDITLP